MKHTTQTSILRNTFTALFAALICVGCFISIPMPGGVPITVQNMFAILSALILGGFHGAGAVGLFLILGGIGVPVFSGAVGGMNILVGPTGGFLWGYFLGALAAGLIAGTPYTFEKKFTAAVWLRIAAAALIGTALIYAPGIPWFLHVMAEKGTPLDVSTALSYTLIPFIPGDVIKVIISIPLAAVLRPVAARYLYPAAEEAEAEIIAALKKRRQTVDALTGKKDSE